eukprot:scaffold9208_cov154-Amphora_coffeaeformis.AAC.13
MPNGLPPVASWIGMKHILADIKDHSHRQVYVASARSARSVGVVRVVSGALLVAEPSEGADLFLAIDKGSHLSLVRLPIT